MIIHRLERLENNGYKKSNKRRFNRRKSKLFCKHCSFINKQLGADLDVRHDENNCNKKKISINVLEAMSKSSENSSDEQETSEDEKSFFHSSYSSKLLQTEDVIRNNLLEPVTTACVDVLSTPSTAAKANSINTDVVSDLEINKTVSCYSFNPDPQHLP